MSEKIIKKVISNIKGFKKSAANQILDNTVEKRQLFIGRQNLMAQYNRKCGRRCPALDFVEFRVTYPTRRDLDQDLLVSRNRLRALHEFERRFLGLEILEPL